MSLPCQCHQKPFCTTHAAYCFAQVWHVSCVMPAQPCAQLLSHCAAVMLAIEFISFMPRRGSHQWQPCCLHVCAASAAHLLVDENVSEASASGVSKSMLHSQEGWAAAMPTGLLAWATVTAILSMHAHQGLQSNVSHCQW